MGEPTIEELWARLEPRHGIVREVDVADAYKAGRITAAETKRLQKAVKLHMKRQADEYLRSQGYDVE